MVSDFGKKQKRSPRKELFLMMGAILVLFIVILLIVANIRIYQKRQKYLSQIEGLENKIQELKNQNNKLDEGILRSDDADYIEKVAREELDLQKPGENVVSFIVQKEQEVSQKNEDGSFGSWVASLGNFWNSLVGWFK